MLRGIGALALLFCASLLRVRTERLAFRRRRCACPNTTFSGVGTARAWLRMQAEPNLAKHMVETYGRSMEDFLRFTGREGVQPAQATREHLAAYARDLLTRANPRQPNVVRLDSGGGLANATILLRLAVIRLFFDYLVEEGLRSTNPGGRMPSTLWRRAWRRSRSAG